MYFDLSKILKQWGGGGGGVISPFTSYATAYARGTGKKSLASTTIIIYAIHTYVHVYTLDTHARVKCVASTYGTYAHTVHLKKVSVLPTQ